MLKHQDVVSKRKRIDSSLKPTDWGWITRVARTDAYEVWIEAVGPGARKGLTWATGGPITVVVLRGRLWVKEEEPASTRRLVAGQAYVSPPERRFELATGNVDAQLLLVKPTGCKLERVAGTGNRIGSRPIAQSFRRPQRSADERAALANAALGVNRTQPLPGPAKSAAEVQFGFNQHGVNLAPVVPES